MTDSVAFTFYAEPGPVSGAARITTGLGSYGDMDETDLAYLCLGGDYSAFLDADELRALIVDLTANLEAMES
jgi:hypothetical protein